MKAAPEYRGFLFHKLGKLLTEECNMPAGTKVELESMEKQLKLLLEKYNIIRDVPLSEVQSAESTWLCHTKKLFCDAEVLVHSLLVPAEGSEPSANPDGIENTSSHEIADTKIKNMTERGLLLEQLLFIEAGYPRALYKQEEETELVGIDGPRDEVIKMLAEGDDDMSENQVKKVFITGIGGSGKTTLARLVYNQLKPQFDCGAFVRVPDFVMDGRGDAHSFFCEMLSQLDVENHMNVNKSAMDWYGLLDQVKQFLQNKRFLVVFDDIQGSYGFNHILSTLANDVYGSRIISTIRIDAMIRFDLSVLDKSVYKMKSLGYIDARKLFLKQFFVCEASFPTAATAVLKEILKVCGGNPSVIISIALVLATRVTATQQWAEMLNSVYSSLKQMASSENFKSDHSEDFEELTHILLLPCSHLPRTLQNCLLYLTVHARNQKIHGTAMVRKWIATNFISDSFLYYGRNLDELASQYFDELIDRNFIQLVEYGNYLGEEIYEVNNMMRNVLMWWSQEVELAAVFSDGDTSKDYDRSKCLSIQCSGSELSVYASKMYYDIYSITIVGPVKFYVDRSLWALNVLDLDGCKDLDNSAMDHICHMSRLRYLSLKHTQVTEIPPEIGKLINLTNLEIRQTEISNLPPEIGELRSLETLDIRQTEISNLPPEIGKLEKLKTLDASHTQISTVPREIAELQNLETLGISQTKISNLPPEIGKLQNLKTLDASRTQISSLPREIAELQNLETLDVRQTQVKELPKELFELPKLANIYYGESSSLRGVKLPLGIEQWESVEVLQTVDSREWSGSAMEITNLTGVRELEVVLHDQPADKDQNVKLLSSIGKCENLEFLRIHGDYNPSDDVIPAAANFPLLERLTVAGRFVKVPSWIALLNTLKKIDIRVCKLDQDDLKILGGLTVLSTLALALICNPWKKSVAITNWMETSTSTDISPREETSPGGFMSLEVFSFDCRVPWITFEQGAMPSLKELHLKLYACPTDKLPSGLINLRSLEKIILQYPPEYASSAGIKKVVSAMKEEASSHHNLIVLSVNGYHVVILPNTKVDETITGTEIEEDSNHVNGIELSVNADHVVLDTRVDEAITVTETEEASKHGNPIKLSVDGDHEVLLSNTRVDETRTDTEIKECY